MCDQKGGRTIKGDFYVLLASIATQQIRLMESINNYSKIIYGNFIVDPQMLLVNFMNENFLYIRTI